MNRFAKADGQKARKGKSKMKTQTIDEMILAGATKEEAEKAHQLFEMLKPGLKIKNNGRIDTVFGDKTTLGLYRMIGSHIFS